MYSFSLYFFITFKMECLLGDMILSVTGSSIENVDDLRDLQYKLSYYTIIISLYICSVHYNIYVSTITNQANNFCNGVYFCVIVTYC